MRFVLSALIFNLMLSLGLRAGVASAAPTESACKAVAAPLERTASRSLLRLASLRSDSQICELSADERATYEAFRPGPTEQVEDPVDALRFERARFKSNGQSEDSCAQRNAVLGCADRYGDAMKGLENAVAYAAIKDPAVLGLARRLAKRLASVIRARATREVLGDRLRAATQKERDQIERAIDGKLVAAYASCTPDQAGCLSSGCDPKVGTTCTADQAHRLRAALGEGNLRETMFFLYMSNGVLTSNASRPIRKGEDPFAVTAENTSNINFINDYLKTKNEGWALTEVPVKYETPFILARTGFGADNNGMRDWRQLADGKTGCVNETRSINQAPVPSLEMITLSPREKAVLATRLGVDPAHLGEQPSPYHSGESCFALKHDITDARYVKYNPLLKNTREAKIPMLTGVSGTTDSLITLGRTLGLHSREDFELLRAAALGWLVSSRDHSVHEVMTAASSFKELPPYRFRPDGYKNILPQHPRFARDVEAYQRAHGLPLPAEVLKTCLTTREASR